MRDQLDLFDQRRAPERAATPDPSAEAAMERSVRRLTAKGETPEYIAERNGISVTDVRRILKGHPAPETIEQRWTAFAARNPHVLEGALQIARAWLDRGDEYISAKAIMENLRIAKHKVTGDGGYKLNNDFTAPMARWLVQNEPRLEGVIRFRERRTK